MTLIRIAEEGADWQEGIAKWQLEVHATTAY